MIAYKLDYLPFDPIILSHSRVWKATFGTFSSPFMKCIMTTPSTSDMCLLSRELTHRSSTFGHANFSPSFSLFYIGGGDIITTLSPRTTIVPRSFELPLSKNSTESSNNKFMC